MIRSLAAFFFLIGFPAYAEISVRSGEHETFTRLVFNMPSALQWQVTSEGTEATVTVSGEPQGFDIANVFERIPRDRLIDLETTEEGVLQMQLACNCDVEGVQFGPRSFFIDIRDPSEDTAGGESSTPADQVAKTASLVSEIAAAALNESETNARVDANAVALPLVLEGNSEINVPTLGFAGVTSKSNQKSDAANDSGASSISAARDVLLQQISRAAGQGLLEARQPEIPDLVAPAPVMDAPADSPNEQIQTPANVNLTAESSMDEALARIFASELGGNGEPLCVENELVDLAAWSPGNGFQQDLGILRRQLFTELNRVAPKIAKDLTKLYLHYGFGAEALMNLKLDKAVYDQNPELRTMGEIIEFGAAKSENAFANQYHCDGFVALWAVLADNDLSSDAEINSDAIIRAFDALPKHIRTYLGPQVSERLRVAGREKIANDVMRIVRRGSHELDAEANMEMSQLAASAGDLETAERQLEAVVESDAPPSPEALVQLIDARIANGEGVDAGLATLAAAYSFEFRDSEIGLELKRVYVLALADSGQYIDAVESLSTLPRDFSQSERRETRSLVFELLTRNASDQTFLLGAIVHLEGENLDLMPEVENQIARRLLDLGVTTHVGPLLKDGATNELSRDRRILRARLALFEERPRNTLSQLLGVSGDDADALRAEAYSMLGDVERSDQILSNLVDHPRSEDSAFLTRNWRRLRDSETQSLSWLANARLNGESDTFQVPASLAGSEELLEESSASLGQIRALLNDFEITTTLPSDISE